MGYKILAFFTVALLGVLIIGAQFGRETPVSFATLRTTIDTSLADSGLTKTITAIADAAIRGEITNDECHTLMHLLGHEAYYVYVGDFDTLVSEVAEVPGVRACLGGYIHGIEAEVVLSGAGIREELFALCQETYDAGLVNGYCYHGVGHTAFEVSHDARKSLSLCDSLQGGPEDDLSGCYRGVFSEMGNAVGGVDTSSNIEVTPLAVPNLDPENPYAYCVTFDMKYQHSCETQLSKLFFETKDPEASFARCLSERHTLAQQETCLSIVGGLHARTTLSNNETIPIPPILEGLSDTQLEAVLDGFAESYRGITQSGYTRSVKSACATFRTEMLRARCKAKLGGS